MNKTGNVFMDALMESGAAVSDKTFCEWGSVEEIKFPFAPNGRLSIFPSIKSKLDVYNAVRRASDDVTLDWIIKREAINTHVALLTWMKSNTSLLRLVNDEEMGRFYKECISDYTDDVSNYRALPSDYRSCLSLYIVYDIINAEFKLHMDFRKLTGEFREMCGIVKILDILNFVSDHRDAVEFIPIVIMTDFAVSHKAYISRGKEVSEVSVSYMGRDIMKNEVAMSKLSDWIAEGNTINPKSRYFILACRSNRSKCYLRKEKAGA